MEGTTQFKNMMEPAIAFEATMQLCDSQWIWGRRFPVAAQDREWRAAGFKPWVTGASEVTSQLCPRRDDGDGFTGVFSWSTEPYSKDSNLEPAERGSTPLISSSQNSKSGVSGWAPWCLKIHKSSRNLTMALPNLISFFSSTYNLWYTLGLWHALQWFISHYKELLNHCVVK